MARWISAELRQTVADRAKQLCEYCLIAEADFQIFQDDLKKFAIEQGIVEAASPAMEDPLLPFLEEEDEIPF